MQGTPSDRSRGSRWGAQWFANDLAISGAGSITGLIGRAHQKSFRQDSMFLSCTPGTSVAIERRQLVYYSSDRIYACSRRK